jgi:predicted glutamine amidotransferase
MCLLIVAPAGLKNVTEYELENADWGNPHGIGVSYLDNGLMTTEKMVSLHALTKLLPTLAKTPCMVHFRYATHGTKDAFNCHPFVRNNWVLAHNGVLSCPDLKIPAGHSDTHALADELAQFSFSELASVQHGLAERIGKGNKLGFFSLDGKEYFIVNEEVGHWRDGVWFSNESYVVSPSYFPKVSPKKGKKRDSVRYYSDPADYYVLSEFETTSGEEWVAYEDLYDGHVYVAPADEVYCGDLDIYGGSKDPGKYYGDEWKTGQ